MGSTSVLREQNNQTKPNQTKPPTPLGQSLTFLWSFGSRLVSVADFMFRPRHRGCWHGRVPVSSTGLTGSRSGQMINCLRATDNYDRGSGDAQTQSNEVRTVHNESDTEQVWFDLGFPFSY
jgi:hypothetical protein